MTTPSPHLLALAMIHGLGPVTARNLIAYCGGAERVFSATRSKLCRVPGVGAKHARRIAEADTLNRAEAELRWCEREEIRVLSYLDEAYPHPLQHIADAPIVLFQRGPLDLNAQPAIAIVGTRKATDYGREQAERLAVFFAENGLNVVSGLAYGVDVWAHKATLEADGLTTAVVGTGLDTTYPARHAKWTREIAERGAVLSEYPSGARIDPGNFPARNRIIAGLCRAVIVVEAAAQGGALITAKAAFGYDREVYALPGRVGDPYSKGCNALIRDQMGKLLVDPGEVLRDLGLDENDTVGATQLSLALDGAPLRDDTLPELEPDEIQVLEFLTQGDALIDTIAFHTQIDASRLNVLLINLEFRGLVRQMPGKKYRRL